MPHTSSADDNSECEACYEELGKNPVVCSKGWRIWSDCAKAYIESIFSTINNFDKIEWSWRWGGILTEKDVENNMTEKQKEIIRRKKLTKEWGSYLIPNAILKYISLSLYLLLMNSV